VHWQRDPRQVRQTGDHDRADHGSGRAFSRAKEPFDMIRTLSLALVSALALVASSAALAGGGPITKQNGKNPLFTDFTSICAVAGYVNYGDCAGSTSTFGDVKGRINAIQAKPGRWNLGISFKNLHPGTVYRLWGNRDGLAIAGELAGFFQIGTVTAGFDGSAEFDYQTTDPANLGFDLNYLRGDWDTNGITVVTSYWSQQSIKVMNPDGTLYIA
jgi:hypothetical protein